MPSHLLEHQPDRNAYQFLGARTDPRSRPVFALRALGASGGTATAAAAVTAVEIAAVNDSVDDWLPRLLALKNSPAYPVSALFTPTDSPDKDNLAHLQALHAALGVPSAYLLERCQGVTHSFGTGATAAWLHFLCKTIQLHRNATGGYSIAGQNNSDDHWMHSGWHLSYAEEPTGGYRVCLLTSGQFPDLENRLSGWLAAGDNLQTVRKNPYALWIPILMEVWKFIDDTTWGLNTVFGGTQASIVLNSDQMELNTNYQELHNLAKHIVHLSEGSSAILCSLESLLLAHARRFPDSAPVHDAVEYQRSLFQSTNLRLQSLSKKVENTINLTYHIAAQKGNKLAIEMNKIILMDSTSMRVIATVTMLFLPGTAIATMFGSNFFEAAGGRFVMSRDYWIFWLVALPVTFIVYCYWYWSLRRGRKRLKANTDSEHSSTT